MEKKFDGNYTRMLRAILNRSWRQQPSKQQLYGHLPPITKTIQIRRNRHAGHCWKNKDELISDVLLWTPSHGRAKAGRPARTYKQQLCEDTGCSPEDLLKAMNDRERWQERVRDIRTDGTTRWWWSLSKNGLITILQRSKIYSKKFFQDILSAAPSHQCISFQNKNQVHYISTEKTYQCHIYKCIIIIIIIIIIMIIIIIIIIKT